MIVKVPSKSKPGEFHDVDLDAEKCPCEAFAFRGKCSHLAIAREMAARMPPQPPPAPEPEPDPWA